MKTEADHLLIPTHAFTMRPAIAVTHLLTFCNSRDELISLELIGALCRHFQNLFRSFHDSFDPSVETASPDST